MPKEKSAAKKKKYQYATTKDRLDNRDKGGGKSVLKLPEGVSQYRFEKEGKVYLDIMPFVAGDGNPCVDKGILYWERTFYTHNKVGPNEDNVVCAARTFNKPCPICERRQELIREGADKDETKALMPKQRQVFLVIDRKDKDKGVQVFETYGWTKQDTAFGQRLDAKLDAVSDDLDHAYHNFWHLEDGLTVQCNVKKEKMPNGSFLAPGNIELIPRKSQYKESLLDDIPCLDDMIEEPDYDEVKALFEGETSEEDDDDEDEDKPKNKKDKKSKNQKEEDDESDEDEDEGEDDEGDEDEDEDESEDDEDSDEDEDEEEWSVGDSARFKYKKKTLEGEVTKVNKKKGILSIQCDDRDEPHAISIDDETLEKVEDDDDDTEDEDDSPLEGEDDADDDEGDDEGDEESEDEDEEDEDEDDEDGDDDESEDEEDEESDEKPAKKKAVKKKAQKKDDDDDEEDEEEDDDWEDDDEEED